jgi:4'-phosphopantetheinyl transferase
MQKFITPKNEIHIYKIRWREFTDTENLLLPKAEQTQMEKYKIHDDKMRFAVGRNALRSLSAKYLQVDANALKIGTNDYGKPFWQSPHSNLKFNISHSGDWVVLAFADVELGVDVESLNRRPKFDFHNIANYAFHPDEVAAMGDDKQRFFDIWVCKEAAIKALGVGLSAILQQLSVLPLAVIGGWSNIEFEGAALAISRFAVDETHVGAVAVVGRESPEISFRDFSVTSPSRS